MIDKALVEACYRAILGRPPETESVVAAKVAQSTSAEALIGEFLASSEFQRRAVPTSSASYFYDRPHIEVDMSDTQRAALFSRLQSQWRKLGEAEPFWSVLTRDEYRAANLDDAALARFYDSGADHAQLVEHFYARSQADQPNGVCVELGCGVGRITKHLARRFKTVIAVDISDGNLRECRAMAAREGLSNIDFILLASPNDIESLRNFDFFFSTIVLQHNQPPIQKYILDIIFSKLNPGGGFMFQTQTYHPGYSFSTEDYLASPPSEMEMHSLPMPEVLRLIESHGHRVREVMEDFWTGRQGSHTFFGLARAPRPSLLRRLFAFGLRPASLWTGDRSQANSRGLASHKKA